MTEPTLDVLAIGNAIVDVLAPVDEVFLAREGLAKGSMRLIDADEAHRLYTALPAAREVSGGSAANTAVGIAALGGRAGFVGRTACDELGQIFAHDIRAAGVRYETACGQVYPPTARCLIAVTPDAQRTMSTYLGAAQELDARDLADAEIAGAAILYLEGYLWDPEVPRAAMRRAIDVARAAGRKVAFSLSDAFLLSRHGDDFRALLAANLIDILFANEIEAMALSGAADFEGAARWMQGKAPIVVMTRGAQGAVVLSNGVAHSVAAAPVSHVVDTTGAGDLFAAGFLFGVARGEPLQRCAGLGVLAAAEIISHYGARPEANLRALAGLA